MRYAQVILLLALSFAPRARAGWSGVLERSGFFGQISGGASYQWSERHIADFLLGRYLIEGIGYTQMNLAYRYSRWTIPFYGNEWQPLQWGVFTVLSLDGERFFLNSPGRYPYSGYYDETALRYGLEFGSTFTFLPSRVGVGYHLRIFDTGVIAIANNSHRDLQYYISSGLSLEYRF